MSNQLGKTIRILRQAKDMKMSDAASDSGVSVPYLSMVENGIRQPSLDVLRRIATALDVPAEALVAMGMAQDGWVTSDKRAAKLNDAVGRLMEIEDKLTKLLAKEFKGATKGRSARAHRRSDGVER